MKTPQTKVDGKKIIEEIKELKNKQKETKMKHFKENTAQFIETKIVPFIAKVMIAALALRGVANYLPTLDHNQQLAGSVAAIALLSYVAYKSK
jgi:hypothetical protein